MKDYSRSSGAICKRKEWIELWNSHDPDKILNHFAVDVEFNSPFVAKLIGETSGTIEGEEYLKNYFKKDIEAYPELKFTLLKVLTALRFTTRA